MPNDKASFTCAIQQDRPYGTEQNHQDSLLATSDPGESLCHQSGFSTPEHQRSNLEPKYSALKFCSCHLPCLAFSWFISPWLVHISVTPGMGSSLERQGPPLLPIHTTSSLPFCQNNAL